MHDALFFHSQYDLEIDRMEGKSHIKHSVPALSELTDKVQAESDKTQDSLKKVAGGRRGGKRQLDRNLWEKLA